MTSDLDKKDMYESVKALIESPDNHVHLDQHKLFTLFSLAFQCILFQSTKNPGCYVIRIENNQLAEKLAKKSKAPSTRRFIQSLLLPRKFKYQRSTFYLDFFHLGSWNMTSEIPKGKVKGAIIVKGTQDHPLQAFVDPNDPDSSSDIELSKLNFPKDYYYQSLREASLKTIVIAFEQEYEESKVIRFPFIKEEKENNLKGVTISKNIDWDTLDK